MDSSSMEEVDPQQQLETFKQNDAYRQLLAFTEVRTACQHLNVRVIELNHR
jgi:hypothetical protein